MCPSNIAVWRCVMRRSGPASSPWPMPRPERFPASLPEPPAHSTEVSANQDWSDAGGAPTHNPMSPLSDLVSRFRVSEHSRADTNYHGRRRLDVALAREITGD
jgi:hypothetical protein